MKTFKLIIAFDGTDFCGWQIQPEVETVHSCLSDSFRRAFSCDAKILGPSRTDAGVHALGYVASLKTDLDLPAEKIREVWNARLPESVVIRSIESVRDDFDLRSGIVSKEYNYHFFLKRPLPFVSRYGFYSWRMREVDLGRFDTALRVVEGEHDFRAFCSIDCGEVVRTVRTVGSLRCDELRRWGVVRVVAKSPGFLRYQIRRMIGAAFALALRRDESFDLITRSLDTGEVSSPRLTLCLPAKGLCLRRVVYGVNLAGGEDGERNDWG